MRWRSPFRDRSVWHWRYAWLPTRMDDGTWVWRERYRVRRVDTGHMWTEMTTQRHLTEREDW